MLSQPSAARDLGPLNDAQRISVTVYLNRPNQALFTKTVDALYDRTSPAFHRWLSDVQLAKFAPPPAQVSAVRAELEANGLSVLSIARDRSSIRATGTVAAISRTFHTSIHEFSLNGREFRANTIPPALSGVAGSYVSLVSGLESHPVKNMLARALDPETGRPFVPIPLGKGSGFPPLGSIISDTIFGPEQSFTYTTGGALPKATYTGLSYQPKPRFIPDYTPGELQDALGLTAAYKKGLTGAGQTIVLLEGYGYPTMLADANAFAKLTGLPKFDSTNFSAVYPEGIPNPEAAFEAGWNIEIALDIDWAHSIAPGARIVVVATNGEDDQDFETSMQFIIDHGLGNVVSDSWGEDIDILAGPDEQKPFECILAVAAAKGISFQFSSGDSGDNGLGTPVGAPLIPSVAPHATAVGGTSIVNVPGTTSRLNLGWGNDFDLLASGGAPIPQPYAEQAFLGGSGGGSSVFWPKPAWQAALPGKYRLTPDVSALADPFTGVPIVTTVPTTPFPTSNPANYEQVLEVGWGGTSLASPIFTAIWALADQRAMHPLGQAAPTIAGLKTGLIDVLPDTAPFAGAYTDGNGKTTKFTANSIFAPLLQTYNSTQNVFAAVWNLLPGAFAFGLDTSLTVTPGWDNVTGFGTPNGLEFINAAASY